MNKHDGGKQHRYVRRLSIKHLPVTFTPGGATA
jgi:hypothetical protein